MEAGCRAIGRKVYESSCRSCCMENHIEEAMDDLYAALWRLRGLRALRRVKVARLKERGRPPVLLVSLNSRIEAEERAFERSAREIGKMIRRLPKPTRRSLQLRFAGLRTLFRQDRKCGPTNEVV